MYDELVEALRLCAKYGKAEDALANAQKAADAIDELDTLLDGARADNDALCGIIERLKKPRWTAVTEEPPLKVGDDGYNGYLVYANSYYEVADYTADKFDNAPSFHVNGEYEPDVTHYMTLPEPPKEEGKDEGEI